MACFRSQPSETKNTLLLFPQSPTGLYFWKWSALILVRIVHCAAGLIEVLYVDLKYSETVYNATENTGFKRFVALKMFSSSEWKVAFV